MRKISKLKAEARVALRGKYGLLIGGMILVSLISGVGSNLASGLFGSETVFSMVMGQVFSLVISLIMAVFTAGLYYMFIKTSRGEHASVGDLFYLFYHHPDRVIMLSLVLVGVQYLCILPGQIYLYQADPGTEYLEILEYFSLFFLITAAGFLAAWVLTMPFACGYYLLADDTELEAGEALKKSMRLMKGNYGRYIYMKLSFLWLYLLGVLSLGIGLFWVFCYEQMTEAEFYRELRGELFSAGEGNAQTESFRATLEGDYAEA